MNRQQYDDLRKFVQRLEHRLKDSLDDSRHADARRLQDDLRKVEDSLQSYANPRSIEAIVSRLERYFNNADDSVMSQADLNDFADKMRDMIQDLRKFDNY